MRIDYAKVAPEALQAVFGLQGYVNKTTRIEKSLRQLATMRASQINRCAFCLDMHAKELRDMGESSVRIDCLPAWRETDLYTPRERAALAWTEAVTLLPNEPVSDAVYEEARSQFDEAELVELTMCIATINVWNRLNASFHTPPTPAK